MNTFSSMGEAEGAAMAHNARMAADLARLTTVRAETTPEPSAMSVPLSDTRLTEIRSSQLGEWLAGEWRHEYVEADGDDTAYYRLTTADGTVLAQLPDWAGPVALFVADAHEAVPELLAEIDRLRGLLAPTELTNWAEQLQSADLTPHPAFAWCSTTSGYEAAFQVATTDRLTDAARERLLAELRAAFDETVRRVLGYRPATLGAGQ